MADTSNRGLGSDNMNEDTKHDIQSEGGKASHSGQKGGQASGSTSGQQGLGSDNMDPQTKHDIQSEGGKASRGGQE